MAPFVRSRPPRRLARVVAAAISISLVVGACASGGASAPRAGGRADPAPLPDFAAHYTTEGRELTADQQVRHVLSRLTFGARPGDYERVRAEGVDRWIDEQLFPERLPDTLGQAVAARWPALAEPGAQLLAENPPPGQVLAQRAAAGAVMTAQDSAQAKQLARQSYVFVGQLQAARTARAVAGERQLQEVMVDFWENHFNVYDRKDRLRYYLPEYDALIRAHAMGRFRDLLGAVAHSPAMLQYLDNFQSQADSTHSTLAPRRGGGGRLAGFRIRPVFGGGTFGRPLGAGGVRTLDGRSGADRGPVAQSAPAAPRRRGLNENYGRELLELHTLGVDGGYTQQDVIEVARALTGWTVAPPARGGGFVFRPEWHDADAKTILGHAFPSGRGEDEGERVLDLLARHPSTARFVARKLCVRFVSDSPSTALVARAADAFTRSDGDVRATLAVILHSPEFFSRAAYRAKVKTPFELVASAARALGATADTTARTAQLVARLGQPLFGHQAPDGWPETGAAWLNTGSILNRINFGEAVAANRLPGARLDAWPQYAVLRGEDRAAQIDGVLGAFLGGEASPDTRAVLAKGENPLAAQAAQAAPMMADSTGDRPDRAEPVPSPGAVAREAAKPGAARPPFAGPVRPLDPFAQLVGLALGAPEFQRR
ncbi:hypothetical protein tb265_21910 [Gemmatimonadetes bacterium T265]|nr:hypothetical protein tb265_21910 [Gemmatimonadetes bacterium T265]